VEPPSSGDYIPDDELAAAVHHDGYDLVSWQEARQVHAEQQRSWLIEQIQFLTQRAEVQAEERRSYAEGVTKGSLDAYVRAARAFALMTDEEVIDLIPTRFLEESD
jgi:hypothetical protein